MAAAPSLSTGAAAAAGQARLPWPTRQQGRTCFQARRPSSPRHRAAAALEAEAPAAHRLLHMRIRRIAGHLPLARPEAPAGVEMELHAPGVLMICQLITLSDPAAEEHKLPPCANPRETIALSRDRTAVVVEHPKRWDHGGRSVALPDVEQVALVEGAAELTPDAATEEEQPSLADRLHTVSEPVARRVTGDLRLHKLQL